MIHSDQIAAIKNQCAQFINESQGMPVLKNLPISYNSFKKVKVRHTREHGVIGEQVSRAFQQPKLLQRAVFVNGPSSFEPILNERVCEYNIFYVFVPDAFKFLYNPAIQHSKFDELTVLGEPLIGEVLNYGYVDSDLYEGINVGAELIMYNIPYYFCINAEATDYSELLGALK